MSDSTDSSSASSESDSDHHEAAEPPQQPSGGDADESSSVAPPDLDELLRLVAESKVAPSYLAGSFDPERPTTEERARMESSRGMILPVLQFLATRPVRVVGTFNWHSIDVIVFGTGATFDTRFPLLVYFDERAPKEEQRLRLPADAGEYASILTQSRTTPLRPRWFTLSIWVTPERNLVRWDIARWRFGWYAAAVKSQGAIVFGSDPRRHGAAATVPARGDGVAAGATAAMPAAGTSTVAAAKARCAAGCDFILQGLQACGECLQFLCSNCDLPPGEAGVAVRPPGQPAIAWQPCPHGTSNASRKTASARGRAAMTLKAPQAATGPQPGSAQVDDVIPAPAVPASAIAMSVDEPPATAAVTVAAAVCFDGPPNVDSDSNDAVSPVTVAVPVTAVTSGAGGSSHVDGIDSDSVSDPAPAAAAPLNMDPRTAAAAAATSVAVDGGPRGAAHVEDTGPRRLLAGPLRGFPDLPAALWQPPIRFNISPTLIAQVADLVPEPAADVPTEAWLSRRKWSLDDVARPSSTESCDVTPTELASAAMKGIIEGVRQAIMTALSCDWTDHDELVVTEAKFLRHRTANVASAPQNLARRSAGAASRHLCVRVVLSLPQVSGVDVAVVHSARMEGQEIRLVAGNGLAWWSVLGGCPWWGDDPWAEITSELSIGRRGEEATLAAHSGMAGYATVERRLGLELFLFWKRTPRQAGRLPGIGKGGRIGKGKLQATDVLVTDVLFGKGISGLPPPEGVEDTPMAFVHRNLDLFVNRTHFSIPLMWRHASIVEQTATEDPAAEAEGGPKEHMKFNLTMRPIPSPSTGSRVSWPLRVIPAIKDVFVHFAQPQGDSPLSMSLSTKKPQTARRRREKPAVSAVPLVESSDGESAASDQESVATVGDGARSAPPKPAGERKRGRPAVAASNERSTVRRRTGPAAAVGQSPMSPGGSNVERALFPSAVRGDQVTPRPVGDAALNTAVTTLTDAVVKMATLPPAGRAEAAELAAEVSAARAEASAATAAAAARAAELAIARSENATLREQLADIGAQLAAAKEANALLRASLADASARLTSANEAVQVAQREAAEANRHIRNVGMTAPSYQAQLFGMTAAAIVTATGKPLAFPNIPAAPPLVSLSGEPASPREPALPSGN